MIKLDMIVPIIIVIVIVVCVAALTLLYLKRGTDSTTLYDLSTSSISAVANKDLPWNMKTPSSLRFAVLITTAPKTVVDVDCSINDTTIDATSLQQSCNEYIFTRCVCTSINDCTNCQMGKTNLTPLLSLGSFVRLYASGYTSQSDKPLVSTLLTIKTAGNSKYYIESIPLPAIPLQKWTVITIVQEGRRIDVYYGEKYVASTYLTYPPVPAPGSDSWVVGGMNGWTGKIGLFSTKLIPQSSHDVSTDVSQLVDTTGMPYSLDNIDFSFNLNLPSCIFGTCTGLPAIKPPNPFSVYASSVS